ncbi:30S ribosome-binding factor RbfA [Buchnera aphidicola]|uniref:Ribosome-binding factor A n=1 Tax=Buchnera aphidicola (Sarucallis kahawaluokalani) TaxID=1241878 RepID=A0A4D6YD52_9GAMM|nr:30S ribosome-binding factor RbfA [Buchnera aphidicola]QCI26043.1 30S ribosome-binding factor RbfA [Buchnera aphidicola (Sarucallis kahawaluokalani)]
MKLLHRCSRKRSYRSIRVSEELKKAISKIFQNYFHDPRISFFITVSMVQVSKDLSCAKIFVSYINCNEFLKNNIQVSNTQVILDVLQKSSGYIRSILCKLVKLRKIPELIFYSDTSLIEGIKISTLLKKI